MCATSVSPPPDLLPARMLNEFAYCPRLFFLEWVDSEFADSADTVEGRSRHRRVDRESGVPPSPDPGGEPPGGADAVPPELPDSASDLAVERATGLMLSDPAMGLIAKIDLVEFRDGEAVPVDYKKGEVPDIEGNVYEPEKVQLCAQGLVLEAAGYTSRRGQIYFAASNRRVTVEFDEALRTRTLLLRAEALSLASSGRIPPPLVDSPKCPGCSLVGICLPDEVRFLQPDGVSLTSDDVRRMFPARDDRSPLYVQEQGAFLAKAGEVIEVRKGRFKLAEARLLDTSQVSLYGRVQISTQLVQECCTRDIPICYFSYGGWFHGMTTGMGHRNVELRRQQYAAAANPGRALRVASRFVRGKVLNCRTLLRRNSRSVTKQDLRELTRLAFAATRASDTSVLLGIEGAAARLYFSYFPSMLRPATAVGMEPFDFRTRNRRPPRDPVNCLLSFLYAVLAKEAHLATLAVGFDPFLGFYHQPRYGRAALALDLMEEFRPLIADSVVLQVVNTGEIAPSDFITRAGSCALTPRGRKAVLEALERRLEATVTHPIFGYAVSYRRVMEIQARLLGRWLGEEIATYPAFRTR